MKAAINNPYWDSMGGGERYTATLVQFLLSIGVNVDVWWPENISKQIFDRFSLDISKANFTPNKSTQDYDLLFWVSDGSLPLSFAKKTIIHLQIPFHDVSGHAPINYLKSRFYQFVSNSVFTKKFVDKEFLIDSKVIYPPVQTNEFIPKEKTNTILYVGRFSNLTQSKGHSILIESFKNIYRKIPDWKLILAGGVSVGNDSREFASMKSSIRGYPIRIVENPDFRELSRLYSHATLFWSASGFGIDEDVNPAKVEHFGISLVEAMAAGCVPLVANRGGHREIIDSGQNGYLLDSPEELQARTLEIISQPQLIITLSQAAVSKSKIFDIHSFNSEFRKFLKL